MATKKTELKLIPLVVTTIHKGVFFGYAEKPALGAKEIRLERAQMCTYYSQDMKGVFGLAHPGPSRNCKIGPVVPSLDLTEVTSIAEASPEAAEAWAKQPWG